MEILATILQRTLFFETGTLKRIADKNKTIYNGYGITFGRAGRLGFGNLLLRNFMVLVLTTGH